MAHGSGLRPGREEDDSYGWISCWQHPMKSHRRDREHVSVHVSGLFFLSSHQDSIMGTPPW
jgi:hypothetical protein